jgi:hypothetical protein
MERSLVVERAAGDPDQVAAANLYPKLAAAS